MKTAARILRWLGITLGVGDCVARRCFGAAADASRPGVARQNHRADDKLSGFTVAIAGLNGTVPLRIPKFDRIDIGDRDGTYIMVRDLGLDISVAALLAGQLRIRSLSFAEIDPV